MIDALALKLLRIRASNAEIIHFIVLHKLLITVQKLAQVNRARARAKKYARKVKKMRPLKT